MRIDIFRGSISFARGDIERTLDMAQFLETPIGRASTKGLVNDRWTHFNIDPEDGILGTVIFEGQTIDRIFLAMTLENESSDDWSVDRELERKSKHDKWLQQELGKPPYDYAWGQIASEFDAKGLASEIIVVYDR